MMNYDRTKNFTPSTVRSNHVMGYCTDRWDNKLIGGDEMIHTLLNTFGGGISPDDKPIVRTKLTHPYNYDAFVMWQNGQDGTDTVYSDRLFQWDSDKYNALCQKHFANHGQYWSSREPSDVEAFLCDYFGHKITLTRISEYCNQSSGYPYWRFDYLTDTLEVQNDK